MNGATVGFVLLADTFDDPENARIILLSAAGLVVLGLLIAAATVWWWRSSEVEHPALGPLEVMGSRSWWKGDYALRRRRLEAARPEGAEPVDPLTTSPSEPVDLEAAALASPREFDDLLEFPPVATAEPEAEASEPESAGVESAAAESAAAESAAAEGEQVDPVAADAESHDADLDDAHDDAHDDAQDDAHDDAQDDTAAVEAPRPIDPLLRLQHDE